MLYDSGVNTYQKLIDFLEKKRKDANAGRAVDPIWINQPTLGKMTNLRCGDLWGTQRSFGVAGGE